MSSNQTHRIATRSSSRTPLTSPISCYRLSAPDHLRLLSSTSQFIRWRNLIAFKITPRHINLSLARAIHRFISWIRTMDAFRYDSERRYLICIRHGHGVLPSFFARHILEQHWELSLAQRQQLIAPTREEWSLAPLESIPKPSPYSLPIPDLTVYKGFRCRLPNCNGERQVVSRSRKIVRDHIWCVHGGDRSSMTPQPDAFGLQSVLTIDILPHPKTSTTLCCWIRDRSS